MKKILAIIAVIAMLSTVVAFSLTGGAAVGSNWTTLASVDGYTAGTVTDDANGAISIETPGAGAWYPHAGVGYKNAVEVDGLTLTVTPVKTSEASAGSTTYLGIYLTKTAQTTMTTSGALGDRAIFTGTGTAQETLLFGFYGSTENMNIVTDGVDGWVYTDGIGNGYDKTVTSGSDVVVSFAVVNGKIQVSVDGTVVYTTASENMDILDADGKAYLSLAACGFGASGPDSAQLVKTINGQPANTFDGSASQWEKVTLPYGTADVGAFDVTADNTLKATVNADAELWGVAAVKQNIGDVTQGTLKFVIKNDNIPFLSTDDGTGVGSFGILIVPKGTEVSIGGTLGGQTVYEAPAGAAKGILITLLPNRTSTSKYNVAVWPADPRTSILYDANAGYDIVDNGTYTIELIPGSDLIKVNGNEFPVEGANYDIADADLYIGHIAAKTSVANVEIVSINDQPANKFGTVSSQWTNITSIFANDVVPAMSHHAFKATAANTLKADINSDAADWGCGAVRTNIKAAAKSEFTVVMKNSDIDTASANFGSTSILIVPAGTAVVSGQTYGGQVAYIGEAGSSGLLVTFLSAGTDLYNITIWSADGSNYWGNIATGVAMPADGIFTIKYKPETSKLEVNGTEYDCGPSYAGFADADIVIGQAAVDTATAAVEIISINGTAANLFTAPADTTSSDTTSSDVSSDTTSSDVTSDTTSSDVTSDTTSSDVTSDTGSDTASGTTSSDTGSGAAGTGTGSSNPDTSDPIILTVMAMMVCAAGVAVVAAKAKKVK